MATTQIREVILTNASFKCPHCRKTKPGSEFGLRRMGDGTVRNQSWCSPCRSTKRRATAA